MASQHRMASPHQPNRPQTTASPSHLLYQCQSILGSSMRKRRKLILDFRKKPSAISPSSDGFSASVSSPNSHSCPGEIFAVNARKRRKLLIDANRTAQFPETPNSTNAWPILDPSQDT